MRQENSRLPIFAYVPCLLVLSSVEKYAQHLDKLNSSIYKLCLPPAAASGGRSVGTPQTPPGAPPLDPAQHNLHIVLNSECRDRKCQRTDIRTYVRISKCILSQIPLPTGKNHCHPVEMPFFALFYLHRWNSLEIPSDTPTMNRGATPASFAQSLGVELFCHRACYFCR